MAPWFSGLKTATRRIWPGCFARRGASHCRSGGYRADDRDRHQTEWVLRSRYRLRKDDIVAAISRLLDTSDFELENEPSVEEALHVWKKNRADFADCLIGVHYRRLGCAATVTFDARTSNLAGFVIA